MDIYRLITLAAVSAWLWGCSSTPAGPYGYTATYLDARAHCDIASPANQENIERFIEFYDQLERVQTTQAIDQIYAEELYFNDTLITLTSRDSLQEHFLKTANQLDTISVSLLDVLHSSPLAGKPDALSSQAVYLLWEMEARFSVLGKQRLSHTLGISQLCFNAAGQVIFHQDFWDSSQGLDQHLPLLGPPTRWLRQHPDQQ